MFQKNTEWYADRWDGDVDFETGFAEAGEYFQQLVDGECFNKGVLSVGYADLEQQFLAGNGAIYPMGSWFTAAEGNADKDFEVGVFYPPTSGGAQHLMQGLNYGSIGIYNGSEHPETTYEMLKFVLMDDVYGARLLEVDGLFSALDPPLTYPIDAAAVGVAGPARRGADHVGSVRLSSWASRRRPASWRSTTASASRSWPVRSPTWAAGLSELDEFWNDAER